MLYVCQDFAINEIDIFYLSGQTTKSEIISTALIYLYASLVKNLAKISELALTDKFLERLESIVK